MYFSFPSLQLCGY